ncbi:hypothetical protein K449DRAFT_198318 [Hypoxylon sp. EC38]|nr:hypothetical protein K449DRAFT_198318 [Hypoxylon sp. EC38]
MSLLISLTSSTPDLTQVVVRSIAWFINVQQERGIWPPSRHRATYVPPMFTES